MKGIVLAGLYHETNTFVAEVTGRDRFTILRGDELLGCAGDGSPLDGFLEVAAEEGWSVIPAVSCGAMPSGPVADEVFENIDQQHECGDASHKVDEYPSGNAQNHDAGQPCQRDP